MSAAGDPKYKADPEAIAAFLQNSLGDGIHLAIIDINGNVGYHHFGNDVASATEWARSKNMLGNGVYWTVNRVRDGFHSKPKKTDIEEARFVHVDVDPPKDGGHFDKAEAVARLSAARPEPSFIIDSGGGVQGFWRLDEPAENLAAIEAINLGIAQAFDADHCHNIDRLMRLPGTVNWPNKKKIAKGRQPALSSLVVEDEGLAHEAMMLSIAFPRRAVDEQRGTYEPDVGGPYALLTADDLRLGPLDPLRSLIDHPNGRDRSGDALACAGRMARLNYSDTEILGVLTNPANAVSAHILDQRDPRYQALRCIEAARTPLPPTSTQILRQDDYGADAGIIEDERPTIVATSFLWRDPATIPLRPWVYGRWLLRNTITAVVAPGGVGKSSLMASTALALATGRSLLNKTVWEGAKRVWYWNLEDDGDELSRQIHAAAKYHEVSPADCADRLYIDSGLDGAGLCLAVEDQTGFRILKPVVEALVAELTRRKIDVLIVDPFVSSHSISENDNGAIDTVAKEWARIAKRCECSIVLVHHTKKLAGMKVTSEMSRGATALINAARSTLVLNRMDAPEATKFGIEGDDERRRFFNVQDDKHNRAPAEKAEWYRMQSVDLGNGPLGLPGDNIGVVTCWTPPDAFEGLRPTDLLKVQTIVAEGEWRENAQAAGWVGKAVAQALGLDVNLKPDKSRISQLLRQWIENGALQIVERKDEKRELRKYVEVGRWQNDDSAQPSGVGRGKVGQSGAAACPTTTPNGVGGGAGQREKSPGQVGQEPEPEWHENPALGRARSAPIDWSKYERGSSPMILAPGEDGDDVEL